MANGTTQTLSGVLAVDGTALDNGFQTFTTPIAAGSEVTVVLTAVANGGREAYAARNIMVTGDTDQGPPPTMGGLPVPDLSPAGIVFLSLLMV